MIAWGVIEEKHCDPDKWARVKRLARDELDTHGLWITGVKQDDRHRGNHRLTNLRRRNTDFTYYIGDFRACCQQGLKLIEERPLPHERTQS